MARPEAYYRTGDDVDARSLIGVLLCFIVRAGQHDAGIWGSGPAEVARAPHNPRHPTRSTSNTTSPRRYILPPGCSRAQVCPVSVCCAKRQTPRRRRLRPCPLLPPPVPTGRCAPRAASAHLCCVLCSVTAKTLSRCRGEGFQHVLSEVFFCFVKLLLCWCCCRWDGERHDVHVDEHDDDEHDDDEHDGHHGGGDGHGNG